MQHTVEAECGPLAFRYLHHLMKKRPGIHSVKPAFGEVGLVAFGQHEYRFHASELADAILPEITRNIPCAIATEPVDISLCDPIFHRGDHAVPTYSLIIVPGRWRKPGVSPPALTRAVFYVEVG